MATKKLTPEEKQKRKQQKAASKTSKTVTQPKPEPPNQAEDSVHLCDQCAYEVQECEGKPKFSIDADPTLTGAAADRVIECEGFLAVEKMPTADELKKKIDKPKEMVDAEVNYPDIVLVCAGECGKTTEGMTMETKSGEFKQVDESGVPVWTCQECVDKRPEGEARVCDVEHLGNFPDCFRDCPKDECDGVPEKQDDKPGPGVDHDDGDKVETGVVSAPGDSRPDPKRFNQEEDLGICPSCQRPLKRTAYSRYVDAVRCTNPRCPSYRAIVSTLSTGVN